MASPEHNEHSALPLDVMLCILDVVDDENMGTISNFLLAGGHSLLPYARARLYRSITLKGVSDLRAAPRLSRTLTTHPSLRALVRAVTLSHTGFSPDGIPETRWVGPDFLPFQRLTELRALTLVSITLSTDADVVEILGMLPRLERFVADSVNEDIRASLLRHHFHGGPEATAPTEDVVLDAELLPEPGPFPSLKELVVVSGRWDGHSLVRRLLHNHAHRSRRLESIKVKNDRYPRQIVWLPVIQAASSGICSLDIDMSDENPSHASWLPQWVASRIDGYSSTYAFVLDNVVAHCSRLRRLDLHHHPDISTRAAPSFDFLVRVCELFDRQPRPLPQLQRLVLTMVEREGEMVSVRSDLCERLAACILDKARYPSFRKLVIHVQEQVRRFNEVWFPRIHSYEQTVTDEVDALLVRWRAAFSSFGERLEVEQVVEHPPHV
ncbi:hypothetical protein C8Q77DRAFT_1162332 [Trametes polyzona]|nr:hypothetical protein C8Q77DRAFT_1162332 [Trametes polyzona]